MRIGLNGTPYDELSSGARDRFLHLYGEVSKRAAGDEFVLYSPREVELADLFPGRLAAAVRTPLSSRSTVRRFLGSRRWFPARLATDGVDLFVTDHFPVLSGPPAGTLLTVHDLRNRALPGEGSWLRRLYFRHRFPRDVKRATAVVTVSEAMRDEIVRFTGLPGGRIHVVPNGISEAFRAEPRPRGYLLALGVFEKRKNLSLLLDVYAADRDGALPPLVLSGRGGPEEGALRARAARLGLRRRVRFVGYTPEERLPDLLAGARALLVPSLYEGFGLPLLQAFAVDTPVLCSDAAALVEVAGDAALVLPPRDPAAWGAALRRVLDDEAQRQRLVRAGRERAARYRWSVAADRFLAVLDTIRDPGRTDPPYP